MMEKRETVPHHHGHASKTDTRIAQKAASDHHGGHSLQDVKSQCRNAGYPAEHSCHIGCAGVPAAVFANVST